MVPNKKVDFAPLRRLHFLINIVTLPIKTTVGLLAKHSGGTQKKTSEVYTVLIP